MHENKAVHILKWTVIPDRQRSEAMQIVNKCSEIGFTQTQRPL